MEKQVFAIKYYVKSDFILHFDFNASLFHYRKREHFRRQINHLPPSFQDKDIQTTQVVIQTSLPFIFLTNVVNLFHICQKALSHI